MSGETERREGNSGGFYGFGGRGDRGGKSFEVDRRHSRPPKLLFWKRGVGECGGREGTVCGWDVQDQLKGGERQERKEKQSQLILKIRAERVVPMGDPPKGKRVQKKRTLTQ